MKSALFSLFATFIFLMNRSALVSEKQYVIDKIGVLPEERNEAFNFLLITQWKRKTNRNSICLQPIHVLRNEFEYWNNYKTKIMS